MRFYIYFLISILTLTGCIRTGQPFRHIAPGMWRGVLKVQESELPFNFAVFNTDVPDAHIYIEIYNGSEVIRVDSVRFFRQNNNDSLYFEFPYYDSFIRGAYNHEAIEGHWVVTTKKDWVVEFRAEQGKSYRFVEGEAPKFDLTGKWDVNFFENDTTQYKAVGEFKQDGKHLTGTFETTTGDYRFLEGTVRGNKMFLSCFDGSHAFLFQATLADDGRLVNGGAVYGASGAETWEATRNDSAKLPDAYNITKVKAGMEKMSFKFPNENGQMVSLEDDRYRGKVKLIQIMGTWCPNCADEGAYLGPYYEKMKSKGLEVIGLAFEKHKTFDKISNAIQLYKKRFNTPYEVLYAGSNKRDEAIKSLPMLNKIEGYPTLLFVDKRNRIRKVHTGFSGPATTSYEAWKAETEALVEELLKENPDDVDHGELTVESE